VPLAELCHGHRVFSAAGPLRLFFPPPRPLAQPFPYRPATRPTGAPAPGPPPAPAVANPPPGLHRSAFPPLHQQSPSPPRNLPPPQPPGWASRPTSVAERPPNYRAPALWAVRAFRPVPRLPIQRQAFPPLPVLRPMVHRAGRPEKTLSRAFFRPRSKLPHALSASPKRGKGEAGAGPFLPRPLTPDRGPKFPLTPPLFPRPLLSVFSRLP